MKLSIIIPCFNEESTITEIIKKVKEQTHIDKELIVIDDFSTDKSRSILQNDLINQMSNIFKSFSSCACASKRASTFSLSEDELQLIRVIEMNAYNEMKKEFLAIFIKVYCENIILFQINIFIINFLAK